jgi:hypothetical protein
MDSHAREQAFGQYLLGRSLLSEALLRQAQDVSADTRDPLVRSLNPPKGWGRDAEGLLICLLTFIAPGMTSWDVANLAYTWHCQLKTR